MEYCLLDARRSDKCRACSRGAYVQANFTRHPPRSRTIMTQATRKHAYSMRRLYLRLCSARFKGNLMAMSLGKGVWQRQETHRAIGGEGLPIWRRTIRRCSRLSRKGPSIWPWHRSRRAPRVPLHGHLCWWSVPLHDPPSCVSHSYPATQANYTHGYLSKGTQGPNNNRMRHKFPSLFDATPNARHKRHLIEVCGYTAQLRLYAALLNSSALPFCRKTKRFFWRTYR